MPLSSSFAPLCFTYAEPVTSLHACPQASSPLASAYILTIPNYIVLQITFSITIASKWISFLKRQWVLVETDCTCNQLKCCRDYIYQILKVLVVHLCLTLCDPMDCSPPGSYVHGIVQARILEWVDILFSRGSSQPRDWTWVSSIAGRLFTVWATREAPNTR